MGRGMTHVFHILTSKKLRHHCTGLASIVLKDSSGHQVSAKIIKNK